MWEDVISALSCSLSSPVTDYSGDATLMWIVTRDLWLCMADEGLSKSDRDKPKKSFPIEWFYAVKWC